MQSPIEYTARSENAAICSHSNAHAMGAQAYRDGKPYTDNPWSFATIPGQAWQDGYWSEQYNQSQKG